MSYHPDYGWVMQQNTGPTPQSYVFEAQAAAYSHYWRRDRYGYVIEEGNVADQGTPGVFGRRLQGLDAWGNPTRQQFGNGLVDLRTYRPGTGQMNTVCIGAGPGLCGTLEMNYGYDAQGCASAAGAGCAGAADLVGNQVAQRRGAGCAQVMRQVSYDVTHRPERIEADGKRIVFRYDGDGNRYLQRRQLADQPSTDRDTTTVYPFPGYEVEVQRTGGTFTVASGRQMLGDYGVYTASVANPQGQVIYRHGDRLGSPAAQSDGQGQAVERRGFDAWGAPREGTWTDRPGAALGSAISPRGFTGHEHLDDVGGLIHMNGRAYDPRLGRFLSVDPIIQFPANSQSLNPYSYLMNNPMSGTDPTGYACKETDSMSGCAGNLEEGETKQVRSTELGSRISKAVGTVTGMGNGAVKVTSLNGNSGIITNVGNGARGMGSTSIAAVGNNRADGSTNGRPDANAVGRGGLDQYAKGRAGASASDKDAITGSRAGSRRARGTGSPITYPVVGKMAADGHGPPGPFDSIEDAARAGLAAAYSLSKVYEYAGAVVAMGGGYVATNPVTIESTENFAFQLPAGIGPVGLYHTHPVNRSGAISVIFSANDVEQAQRLGVRSFIGVHHDSSIRHFDPSVMRPVSLRNFGGTRAVLRDVSEGELLCSNCFR